MAVIGRIRKHSGLLIIIIGVALAGFVLQDFFGKSSGRRGSNEFAVIDGEKISKLEFDYRVMKQEEETKRQNGVDNLTPEQNYQIMTKAWDQLEYEFIMQKEYEELGLAVEHDNTPKASISPEELEDLLYGRFIHPYIAQSFSDPTTGEINRQQIQQIFENFDQLREQDREQLTLLKEAAVAERISNKYNQLVAKAFYMPATFINKTFTETNTLASVRLLGVKYQTISDSTITVTDEDFQKYYDEHKHEYIQEPSCDIDYVIWDVVPSADDKKKVDEEVARIYEEFQTVENKDLEYFVNANSDDKYDSIYRKQGILPKEMDTIMFSGEPGAIVAPFLEDNVYFMCRLVQTQMRPDSMKASHILIQHNEAQGAAQQNITRTKEQAKNLIDSLMQIVKADPSSFSKVAFEKSEYGSAKQDSGDIGWFVDGDINYKFFYDSCMTMNPGEMKIIMSNLGYHILYFTAKDESVKKAKVAIIAREIKPGTQTFNNYYTQASEFAGQNRTTEQFQKAIIEKGLSKRTGEFIQKMEYSLPGLENSREIIRWAFDENTEQGTVSQQVFDAQGKYVVALLVSRREKGIATLEQVKKYIEPLVKRDKKAEMIIANMNTALATTKDIYQLAVKLNTKVDTINTLTFSGYNLPNYGPEASVIGSIFAIQKNTLSDPLKGTMAVYLVTIDELTEPPAGIDNSMYVNQMQAYFYSRVNNDIYPAIKDEIEIIDNRIFYY